MALSKKQLQQVMALMQAWCDIKFRGTMGSGRDDTKEIKILGRRLRRTNKGLELEVSRNPRLKLLRGFGLNEDSKGLSCPVVQGKGKEEEGRVLCKHEASKFRGGVALMNFLGQDRPDVQYAAKKASHKMASPTETDLLRLKRITRYLVEAGRVVWHDEPVAVEAFVDSAWAGCLSTRKSTSGGVLSAAGTGSTQGSVATSLAEAEYYAALKGAAEALEFASLARDLGYELDSSERCGSQKRTEQPHPSHGGEVLVATGRTGERAAGLEKGAHVCQPCRCSHEAHGSRRNEKAICADGWRTPCSPDPCRLGPSRGVGESTPYLTE